MKSALGKAMGRAASGLLSRAASFHRRRASDAALRIGESALGGNAVCSCDDAWLSYRLMLIAAYGGFDVWLKLRLLCKGAHRACHCPHLDNLFRIFFRSDYSSLCVDPAVYLRAFQYAWLPSAQLAGLTSSRAPAPFMTVPIRSRRAHKTGVHRWHLCWKPASGSHAAVGVVTENCPLQSTKGYSQWVGAHAGSWGIDLFSGTVMAEGTVVSDKRAPKATRDLTLFAQLDMANIALIIDADKQKVSVELALADGSKTTVTIARVPKRRGLLYPCASMVHERCTIRLTYLGPEDEFSRTRCPTPER